MWLTLELPASKDSGRPLSRSRESEQYLTHMACFLFHFIYLFWQSMHVLAREAERERERAPSREVWVTLKIPPSFLLPGKDFWHAHMCAQCAFQATRAGTHTMWSANRDVAPFTTWPRDWPSTSCSISVCVFCVYTCIFVVCTHVCACACVACLLLGTWESSSVVEHGISQITLRLIYKKQWKRFRERTHHFGMF